MLLSLTVKTVTNLSTLEWKLSLNEDSIALVIDEKAEVFPYMPNTREDLAEAFDNWNMKPESYKTLFLIPFTGESSMPSELPNDGWHLGNIENGESDVFVKYVVLDESKLDYVDRIMLAASKSGSMKQSVEEYLAEAELYCQNRDIQPTRENIFRVIMDAENIPDGTKRSIKHSLISYKSGEVVGTKPENILNVQEIISFCKLHDIRWVVFCAYYFSGSQDIEKTIFVKHLLNDLLNTKKIYKELKTTFFIFVPEVHTYLRTVGFRSHYLARDVFIDVLSKGRSMSVFMVADTQAPSLLPDVCKEYFDLMLVHRLNSQVEIADFIAYRYGITNKLEVERSERLMISNLNKTEAETFESFEGTREGFVSYSRRGEYLFTAGLEIRFFPNLVQYLQAGECVFIDRDGEMWMLDFKLKFPMCKQSHEDVNFIPFKDVRVSREQIAAEFIERSDFLRQYELLRLPETPIILPKAPFDVWIAPLLDYLIANHETLVLTTLINIRELKKIYHIKDNIKDFSAGRNNKVFAVQKGLIINDKPKVIGIGNIEKLASFLDSVYPELSPKLSQLIEIYNEE